MLVFKKIITAIIQTKVEEYSRILEHREFISRQLRVLDMELKLLAFLGRKSQSNFKIIFPSESIEISHSTIKGGPLTVIEVSENFTNYDERVIN